MDNKIFKNKRVLVTCGPTWVPIDNVRVISNLSSGTLGQVIAQDFSEAGAKVTLMEGPVAKPIKSSLIKVLKFNYFDELHDLIKAELRKKYDICIHAAAVADYKVKQKRTAKLSSQLKTLTLKLIPTKKIIRHIRKLNPKIFLVGFKLEPGLNKVKAVQKTCGLFRDGLCDLVVANSVDHGKYEGYILDQNGSFFAHDTSRKKLSKSLIRTVKKSI